MLELMRAFIDIALWRKGPQHLPHSGLLFAVTTAAYFLVSLALTIAADQLSTETTAPPQPAGNSVLASALINIAMTLAWIIVMLFVLRRTARFYQTATAVFGAGIVIEPIVLQVPLMIARIGAGPVAGLLFPLLLSWYLVVLVHIVRNALEVTLFGAALLTAGFVICQYLFL